MMTGTYQTRVKGYAGISRSAGDGALGACAELYGRVQRKLFAKMAAGYSAALLKSAYLKRYGISARFFNAVRISLQGKVASVREGRKLRLDDLQRRIARAKRQIAKAEERGRPDQAHHKRRRLVTLVYRLMVLKAELKAGLVRLCFGSKKLWHKQFYLAENGYASHDEWLEDWQQARSNEFFLLGSKDETSGCQLCVAAVADDGSLTLRLRMPDALAEEHGKYVTVTGVRFAYGHEQVLAALGAEQAISYRFKRDTKGWRVFATTKVQDVPVVTDKRRGAVGVDLNADHLAVAETDLSGNYVHAFSVPLVTYGKSRRQAEALIGDAVARVVEYAKRVGKPVSIERLNFRKKKTALEGQPRKYSRMLSSFSYGKTLACFLSRGPAARRSYSPGQPDLQFRHWPGEVHEEIRAEFAPVSSVGAGPSFAWLFRAHSPPVGLPCRQWRPCHLPCTCKEAREACMDVLGCNLGTVETGACSAIPAGEVERRP